MQTRQKQSSWYALLIALVFISVFTFVVIKFLSQAREANDELIAEHVERLRQIFKKINDTSKISGFRHKKDYIDFLNVRSFEGSVVGPMNLVDPTKWQGPYVQESLTIDGQEYQILATKKGFYIIPGDGVKLSNGKIIGKTLLLNANSDMEALIIDKKALLSNGKPLAAKIETVQNPFEALTKTDFLEDTTSSY